VQKTAKNDVFLLKNRPLQITEFHLIEIFFEKSFKKIWKIPKNVRNFASLFRTEKHDSTGKNLPTIFEKDF